MKLFKTKQGIFVQTNDTYYQLRETDWDELFNRADLLASLQTEIRNLSPVSAPEEVLAPIGAQEVWAAGVTYYRSRTARMEESKDAGGGSFYDRVYSAERPELFFKANPHRVSGTGGDVKIRQDSQWNVPEPELALAVNARGEIIGYTIGNDMSSRDIEGENPLYLPQAKVYDLSCGLGPAVYLTNDPLSPETQIRLEIMRNGEAAFTGETTLAQLKRTPQELVGFLYRDNTFPVGSFLLTGTGIVPPDSFTLHSGDEISITIDSIGTLVNTVL
jgi:2-dehydro-3-deoxy-D-arabinonate dehydratase